MKQVTILLFLIIFSQVSIGQILISYNQAGYYPEHNKRIIIQSDISLQGTEWNFRDIFNTVVLSGTIAPSIQGVTDYTAKSYNYEIPFSSITTQGIYTFELQGHEAIEISINCDPYSDFIFKALRGIRVRRSNSEDALIHGLSHTGDISCPIYERGANNSDWSPRSDNKTANMLGGWYDAGDYIKFTLTCAYATYFILKSYDTNPELFRNRKTYSTTALNDMLDEAKHGLDFLMKTMPEPGIFIIQTGGHLDHTQGLRMPENDLLDGQRECYSALSKTQMGLTAAALALGAKIFSAEGFNTEASQYAQKAEDIFEAALASTESPAWWEGGYEVFYADNSEADNMALAALELYRLTGENTYLTHAQNFSQLAGSSYWAAWSNVNMTAHANIYPYHSPALTPLTQDLQYFRSFAQAAGNIWNTPHATTWGTLYSYFSVAHGALQHALVTEQSTFEDMAIDVLDYTFGLNHWGLAFMASEKLPHSITSAYAVMYRLQPHLFPTGEIAEGPTDATTHANNRTWFSPAHNPNLWHADYNTPNFTFFEQDGDYVCMETTLGGLADGLFLLSLASTILCQNPCPAITFNSNASLCGSPEITIESGIDANNGVSFQWFHNGNEITLPSQEVNAITITEAGNYLLIIDSAGVCSNSKTISVSDEIATVSLGNDFTLCKPGYEVLRTNISDPEHNFTWYKNSIPIPHATSDSLLVFSEGTYGVTVSAPGCDSKSASVQVYSNLPTIIHDTICEPGQIQLEINEPGNSYLWYDSPEGTNLVHSGNIFTPTITESTIYYVQDGASNTESVGLTNTTSGWQNTVSEFLYETTFNALQDITITEVTVFSGSNQTLVVSVIDTDGTTVIGSASQTIGIGQQTIPLSISVLAGTGYRLSPIGTTGMLQLDNEQVSYPYQVNGIIELTGLQTPWGGQNDWYANFYNIQISVGSGCDLTPVFAIIDPNNDKCGPYTTQNISLEQGWNLISVSVLCRDVPSGTDVACNVSTVFENLDVEIVKNADGFWKPDHAHEFNSLHALEPGMGYLVYMNMAATITISGIPCTGGNFFAPTGWQLIGHPCCKDAWPCVSTPISDYFNTTNSEIIKNFDGFWEPNGATNSIQNFEAGKGYYVKN